MADYITNGIKFQVLAESAPGGFRGWFDCPICGKKVSGGLKSSEEAALNDGMMCAYTHSRTAGHRHIGPPLQSFDRSSEDA